ncbi:hypothetical protein M0R45_011562 [Rubus argutus]|uniref:Uncharacterized protein n=1 Tax=Rubus argutus TaxID=59490 RepID=A0AAW1YAA3_RUBAR
MESEFHKQNEGESLPGTELKESWRVAKVPENDKFQYTYFAKVPFIRPGSVVGDLWWLAGGHVFGGQVHNYQEAYEKHDGTFRKFKGKLASQNSSALENKLAEFEDGGLALRLICSHLLADPTSATMFLNVGFLAASAFSATTAA